jgi:hypothetical protein
VPVDFAQAFRDGSNEAPSVQVARTEVEDILARFCHELETAAPVLTVSRGNDDGAWIRLLMSRPGGRLSPSNGADLLAYRRADQGYPVALRWVDGRVRECVDSASLEAELGNMLRDPHCNARIRNAIRDFGGSR